MLELEFEPSLEFGSRVFEQRDIAVTAAVTGLGAHGQSVGISPAPPYGSVGAGVISDVVEKNRVLVSMLSLLQGHAHIGGMAIVDAPQHIVLNAVIAASIVFSRRVTHLVIGVEEREAVGKSF